MGTAWNKITVEDILPQIKGSLISGPAGTPVSGVSTDSRSIKQGEIFWSLIGERYDGHDFIPMALEQGAAGAVIEKHRISAVIRRLSMDIKDPLLIAVDDTLKALGDMAGWWRRQHDVQVVAITGSVGKTTTKEMLAEILSTGGNVLKNYGNFNNLIGLPLTLLHLNKGYGKTVVEMGMNRPGEIARLTGIASPDLGIITDVAMAHLEGVGGLQGVANAKVELVKGISPESPVVINGDNDILLKTASEFRTDLIKFGLGEKNDVRAQGIMDLGREGLSFDLIYKGNRWPVKLRVSGLHNILNALAACAAGLCLNEPTANIIEGLHRFKGIKGRFTVTALPGNITLVDDTYNANPSSLKAALNSIRGLITKNGKTIVCLGDMLELGEASVSAHREAGQIVAGLPADLFIVMGKYAHNMQEGALMAGLPHDRVKEAGSHQEIIKMIRNETNDGSLILIKGSHSIGLENVVEGLVCKE